ncbi:HEAT repeat domain-containing protein, partial [Acinetobacter baumannii]
MWQVRLASVRNLGRLRAPTAIGPIGRLIEHPQPNLRKESIAALGEIGGLAVVPYLSRGLKDPDPEVRKTAER